MKTLIVYYSNTHNNELLAHDLQKKLACDILKIEEVKKRTGMTILLDLLFARTPTLRPHALSLDSYSNFILVAPIWAGKIASPLRAFLRAEKKYMKRYSFLSLCGGVTGQAEKIGKELLALLQVAPNAIVELWINDLLVVERKNTIKYTSGYRVVSGDLEKFKERIDEFLRLQVFESNSKSYELH
jgi:flavodoxin